MTVSPVFLESGYLSCTSIYNSGIYLFDCCFVFCRPQGSRFKIYSMRYKLLFRRLVSILRMLLFLNRGSLTLDMVDETVVARNLLTAGLPDPDLLIRTSGEKRVRCAYLEMSTLLSGEIIRVERTFAVRCRTLLKW